MSPSHSLVSHNSALRDRAEAAFLGLALGDAYGRTLEFVLLPEVRSTPVVVRPGLFHWTDDTHMSIYLGRAVADLAPGVPLDHGAFGRAVGARFAQWAEDPLTPSTAPGNTCLRGARAFARHGDWQRSGDRGSDGCGAVMRVVPVALGFDAAELKDAARISALVTHAHPNAVEAAIAGAWLCRQALVEGRFDESTVARAIGHLRREWAWGGEVADSLEAALEQGRLPPEGWLEEEAIPPGDGGWRSGSALGLAVAAALRWGPAGFATVVEKAARIEGDSDSVAALAGMLHAAAHGTAALPAAWLDALPGADELREQAVSLWERSIASRAVPPVSFPVDVEEDEPEPDEDPDTASVAPLPSAAVAPVPPAAASSPGPPPGATSAPRPRTGPPVQLSLTSTPSLDEDSSQVLPPEAPPLPGPPQTSLDHPLRVRWLDLGVVGPRAPRGRIGLCPAPGRRDGTGFDRSLGVDLDRMVALHRVDHLVLLLDPAERAGLGIGDLVAEAEARRIVVHPLPLAPGAAPSLGAADVAVDLVLAVARAGRRVVLVSRDAEERGGTLATAALVGLGLAPDVALRAVRAVVGPRAGASDAQRAWLMSLSFAVR